jgi:hypothetical protein
MAVRVRLAVLEEPRATAELAELLLLEVLPGKVQESSRPGRQRILTPQEM